MHRVIEVTGASFADVAIMSAVGTGEHRIPMLACGPGAERFRASAPPLDVEVVDGEPGMASAIKLLRSLVVKGLEAVVAEFHLVADHVGVTERVLLSLDQSLPLGTWSDLFGYLDARTAAHGARRALELDEVAAMSRDLGIEPLVSAAGAQRLLAEARRRVGHAKVQGVDLGTVTA
jgi:3-hydroxyisobutyrate dehydrogenase-like beta-hydroxyacid dehydrogenase